MSNLRYALAFSALAAGGAFCGMANAAITVDFVADKVIGIAPLFVQFTNLSTYPADPAAVHYWDFGDGEFGSTRNPGHLYLNPGLYTVSLAVHSAGEVGTHTKQGYIYVPALIPDFSGQPLDGPAPLTVNFTNLSETSGYSASYLWNFGDGATSSAVNPQHVYQNDGRYTVSLKATISLGSLTNVKEDYVVAGALPFGGRSYLVTFIEPYSSAAHQSLSLSSETGATATVTIASLDFLETVVILPGHVVDIEIPIEATLFGSNQIFARAIEVVADNPIQVYGLSREGYTTDGFVAYPIDVLGTNYRVMSYTALDDTLPSEFAVIAAYEGTQVTITPTASTGSRTAGVPFTIGLNRGDVYQLQTDDSGEDLTGTLIAANQPVAVYSGNSCAYVTPTVPACDHLVEQIPPLDSWGTEHITVSLESRQDGDTIRILAAEDSTSVSIEGPNPESISLNAGEFVERLLEEVNRIESDDPVLVMQFANGSEFDGALGDPFMMPIVPTDRFLDRYTLATPVNGLGVPFNNYLSLVASSADAAAGEVKLDGLTVAPSAFSLVPGTEWSTASRAIDHGTHQVTSANPLGLNMYGFTEYESYGYHGGIRFDGQTEPPVDFAEAMREFFVVLDQDGNDLLDWDEVSSLGLSEALFDALDLDNDGFLSRTELLIASVGPVEVVTPVFVDFSQVAIGNGTLSEPFRLLDEARLFVKTGGTIKITGGDSSETFHDARQLERAVRLETQGAGLIAIGVTP